MPEASYAMRVLTGSIENACRKARAGELTEPMTVTAPAVGHLLPASTLTFSQETFDQDLEQALDLLDRYAAVRAGRFEQVREQSPEEQLREMEEGFVEVDEDRLEAAESFSAFEAYAEGHKARQAERDRAAEDDMRRVTEERRLAQERKAVQDAARRKTQDLNRTWQEEMDAQATREAEAEAAWRREHSAGAFMKKFAWTLAGSTVTSFAGGFAHSVGAGYADYVIRKKYPDLSATGRYEKDYP
ncbi:MAG: hypothetical protein JXB04_01445 [Kiritimatiellae bacterium]|nr:hypothetical protein [Kiritimatiellia bacterium]